MWNLGACASPPQFNSSPDINMLVKGLNHNQLKKVGAQGFEPRPAGIFWSATKCCVYGWWRDITGRSSSWSSQSSDLYHSSFPCNWSQLYYQVILYSPVLTVQLHCLACRRARLRRRSFFLRHFHRWLPVFFHALEPRFMVNSPPTNLSYMRTSQRKWWFYQAKNPFW